jgi:hypothetical protein
MKLQSIGLKLFAIFLVGLFRLSVSMCVTESVDTSVNYAKNGDFETPYLGANKWRFTSDQL